MKSLFSCLRLERFAGRWARRIGWHIQVQSRGFMPLWHVGRVINGWGWKDRWQRR